jgi:hypothetical protein
MRRRATSIIELLKARDLIDLVAIQGYAFEFNDSLPARLDKDYELVTDQNNDAAFDRVVHDVATYGGPHFEELTSAAVALRAEEQGRLPDFNDKAEFLPLAHHADAATWCSCM